MKIEIERCEGGAAAYFGSKDCPYDAERFWRTLDDDVIDGATFDNLDHFASELLEYMVYYNNYRPNQAIGGATPKACAEAIIVKAPSANW